MNSLVILVLALIGTSGSLVAGQQSESDYNTTLITATRQNNASLALSVLTQAQSSSNFTAFSQGLKDAFNYFETIRPSLVPNTPAPVFNFTNLLGQAFLKQPAVFAGLAAASTSGLSNYSIRAVGNNRSSTVDIYARSLYSAINQNGTSAKPILIALSSLNCNSVTLILNYALNDQADAASQIAQFDQATTSPLIQCFQQGGPDLNPSFGSGIRYTGTFVEAFNRARARLSPAPGPSVLALGRRMLSAA